MADLARIDFHGATLWALPGPSPEQTIVVIKPICEHLTFAVTGQITKIKRMKVFAGRYQEILAPSLGGPQRQFGLALSHLNLWLAKLSDAKVTDPAARDRLVLYQHECAAVLFQHFFLKHERTDLVAKDVIEGRLEIIQSKIDLVLDDTTHIRDTTDRTHDMVDEEIRKQRREFSDEIKRLYLRVIREYFHGRCPGRCDGSLVLTQEGKLIGHVEHMFGPQDNRIEAGWVICIPEHRLITAKPEERANLEKSFHMFQEILWRMIHGRDLYSAAPAPATTKPLAAPAIIYVQPKQQKLTFG